jgi:dCTP deaminase
MILTGAEIIKQVKEGNICIKPFSKDQVNPNSYNYCIGDTIKVFCGNENEYSFNELSIPESGYVLIPGQMYLAATDEIIGSDKFSMSLIGRSSLGRLGLFLQLAANLGHVDSCHHWTLELFSAKPIRLYPHMIIGQVSFWVNQGEHLTYNGSYGKINIPQENLNLMKY